MPSLPKNPRIGKPLTPRYIGGYGDVASRYLEQGWQSVLPLPVGEKGPPPKGYTGREAKVPSAEQVEMWRETKGDGNPALYLADGLLGVDIDNYAKRDRHAGRALEVIAGVEERAGVRFPATWVLRNRSDGSEKRLYRVPKGRSWRSGLGSGVELIHYGHRYVNAGVNPGTGEPERWFDPTGALAMDPPKPDELAELPEELVSELMREATVAAMASEAEGQRLLDGLPDTGDMAECVRDRLTGAIGDLNGANGSRHDLTLRHVCSVVEYGSAKMAGTKNALAELRREFVDAVSADRGDRTTAEAEYDRMVIGAGRLAAGKTATELASLAAALTAMEPGGHWHPEALWPRTDSADRVGGGAVPTALSRFRLVSARELAEPVEPMRWLVRGIWPERSAGVLAGEKKSLKTWNLQAIALAVAGGTALFDKYHVTTPGPVLYLCGEGGRSTFANRHQVIAERYGLMDRLAELPFGAEFGVGMLTDDEFTDAVKRHLDELQPALVILDPLYAYHPSDVEVQNLYARGPMLASLRTLIGGEAALIVGDHFNKTKSASGRLDLDNIAQAGMGQWADSWILQKHREPPDLDAGLFRLEVETGTRRGGGRHLEVDWTLERNTGDPDAITWAGVDWDTRPCESSSGEGGKDKVVDAIMQVVRDQPYELTESGVAEKVGGKREKTREALQGLKANGWLDIKNCERQEGNRMVKRDRVGLGATAKRFEGTSSRVGTGSPSDTGADEVVPDEGTSSERVDP
ncbi:AAA family ATPase [Mycobacteroides salmoniphilum]|uniref:AAA family ATPase n=1 Tax=Mycobacteroides salmoniphilum TaxID=404941 RepID=UPI00356ABCF8